MYELRGYIFVGDEKVPCPIMEGIEVSGWEEAHSLITDIGNKYYLITLDKVVK